MSVDKTSFFQEKVLNWFDQHGRSFPWRKKGLTQYQYLIAEVLLQRTKAETIAKFYHNFLREFPNWKSIAIADIEKIENYLKPIGLYRQRSLRLKALAQEMVKRKGILPRDRKELEALPFIGQYIANAIELIIFDKPSPLIDVNMARVLERFFEFRKMADIRYDPYLQALCYKVVNVNDTKEINWAILDFAALVCSARNPKHEICPLKEQCSFFKSVDN